MEAGSDKEESEVHVETPDERREVNRDGVVIDSAETDLDVLG